MASVRIVAKSWTSKSPRSSSQVLQLKFRRVDYVTTTADTSRATINMTHGHTGLKLSESEASKHSESAKKRLLQSRKLSLVVDLDQTIIHAAFDPTIGEWKKDQSNPNYEALQDVRSFKLTDENNNNTTETEYYIQKRAGKPLPNFGFPRHEELDVVQTTCLEESEAVAPKEKEYVIKCRRGLHDFLEEISKKYELHIYTMATRAYAREVAKIIDPDQKYFGDRIVSRDESGSLSHKNLQRIFPIDTKLVVIIDDRADVWHWTPNLIKVTPYCFFVGTGDINAMYLPKQTDGTGASPAPPAASASDAQKTDIADAANSGSRSLNGTESTVDSNKNEEITDIEQRLVAMASSGAEDLKEQAHKQEEIAKEQITERPLQKMQEMLDKQDEADANSQSSSESSEPAEAENPPPKQRHSILHNNDEELIYLQDTLERVHKTFFDEHDRRAAGAHGGRVAMLRGEKGQKVRLGDELQIVPDIKDIVPQMRSEVLKGVVICFTGVIPQGTDHQLSDLGMWARSFGAVIQPNLTKSTTHVVAHKDRRTSKVRQAARHPQIKIVTVDWLMECFSRWRRVSETPHLIEVERDHHGSQESLPFDELEDGVVLSESESTGEDWVATLPDDNDDEGEDYDEESELNLYEKDPIRDEEWDAMNAEVDEFLEGLDTEDEGNESDASTRKRKRDGTDSADGSDAEGTDISVNGDGSELQKRKRRALERTTGLANVAVADQSSGLPSPDTTGPEEENQDDDVDDGFAAAFVAGLEGSEENETVQA